MAKKVAELGKEYNTALLAVERNNHGGTVLVCLRNAGYPRVFGEGGQDGWLTTRKSRPEMLEEMAWILENEISRVRSERALNECRTFVRLGNGNCGAAAGTHDDCVMALGIAWAVRKSEMWRGAWPPGEWGEAEGK
jgi:hypothetical protein